MCDKRKIIKKQIIGLKKTEKIIKNGVSVYFFFST
jgi:hypothetical protein